MKKPTTTPTKKAILSADDREHAACEAAALGQLLQWVSEVQSLLYNLRLTADTLCPSIGEQLTEHRVHYSCVDIQSEDLDLAKYFVHNRQNDLIEKLGGAP